MLLACVWYPPSSFWKHTRWESASALKVAPMLMTCSLDEFNTFWTWREKRRRLESRLFLVW